MSAEIERLSFFATAGRGTESFAANEIKSTVSGKVEISTRDGKVFFILSSAIELNIKKILALRSVERVFVGITDYNNTAYIANKRTFLDKLMCTVASQENFSSAKIVLAEILSRNHENKAKDVNISKCIHSSSALILAGHGGDSASAGLLPVKKKCSGMKTADVSNSREDLESLSVVEYSPAEKYRKLDVLQTAEVSVPKTECDRRMFFDKSSDDGKQTDSRCEYLLKDTPAYDRSIDHICVPCATVNCSQVRQIGSNCDHNVLFDCARQIDSNLEECSNSEKETINSNVVCHKSLLKCNHSCLLSCKTDYKDNQQQTHQHDSITEDNRDQESLSFRMSIKCSGKVSRWLNIKKLSRDLGWRVARTTGWRVDLRKPQYEVCVHISDDYVTAGVPLTRFPLSRRVYMVDSGLRAPIAWIMSQLCCIKSGDIVLDPMCGKATILIEASSDVKDAWFMGSDRDSSQIDKALQNLNTCSHSGTVSLLKADGLNMPYRDGCLDVIVCDAPFNHNHLFTLAPEQFYYNFIKEIYRVLRPQGCCVLLVSEQLQDAVLSVIQGTEGNQQAVPCSTSGAPSQGSLQGIDTRDGHDKTTESVMMLTLISSHYVKLGETHACILVMRKES